MSHNNKSKKLAEKLKQIGSLDKQTDKIGRKKIRRDRKSVTLMGGLHDINRFRLIWVIMAICIFMLAKRALDLQVINADFYVQKADGFITSRQVLTTQRGMIH